MIENIILIVIGAMLGSLLTVLALSLVKASREHRLNGSQKQGIDVRKILKIQKQKMLRTRGR